MDKGRKALDVQLKAVLKYGNSNEKKGIAYAIEAIYASYRARLHRERAKKRVTP